METPAKKKAKTAAVQLQTPAVKEDKVDLYWKTLQGVQAGLLGDGRFFGSLKEYLKYQNYLAQAMEDIEEGKETYSHSQLQEQALQEAQRWSKAKETAASASSQPAEKIAEK